LRSSHTNYAIVGGFVVLMIAGLVAAVAVLTGRTGATDAYTVHYDNVAGVKAGTPVSFEGYRIGEVRSVRPAGGDAPARFRVVFAVEAGFPIPKDSNAAVASTGLLSGSALQIRAGDAEATLDPGSRIAAGRSTDMFAAVSQIAGQIGALSEDGVQPLLAKLNAYTEQLGKTLTESAPKLVGDLRTATRALAESAPPSAGNIQEFTRRLNDRVLGEANLAKVEQTIANMESATRKIDTDVLGAANRARVRETLDNAQTVSQQTVALARNAEQTRRQLDQMIAELDAAIAESRPQLQAGLKDLRYSLQVVSQHVDSIAYNLETTSRNMSEFSRQVRQDPSLLIRGTSGGEDGR
jgi:phospholipid/cholesterol/gamma-HCH transport system substrate-binding protein